MCPDERPTALTVHGVLCLTASVTRVHSAQPTCNQPSMGQTPTRFHKHSLDDQYLPRIPASERHPQIIKNIAACLQ